MAWTCAGCHSTTSFSPPCPLILQDCPLRLQSQRQLMNIPSGFSFVSQVHFRRLRRTPSSLQVSCLRDPKAMVVTGKSWDKLVLNSDIPVLVEFYASWCGPCRMVHRAIDEIAKEYSGKLRCFVLNADEDVEVAEDYEIKAVPVVVLFKNGQKRECVIGTMPKEFYVAAIERVISC